MSADRDIYRILERIEDGIEHINERIDALMATEQDVQAALEGLQQDIGDKLSTISAEVTELEGKISSGTATPEDLGPLKALVENIDGAVKSFNVPSSAGGAGGTTGGPGGGTPGEEAGGGGTPTATKPYYKHVGEGPIDSTQYTPASVTAEDGSQLFEFAGDTAGGSPTGASAEWEPYTGATQAAGPSGV